MALDDGKPSPFLELCALLARETWARQERLNQQAKDSSIEEIVAALTEVLGLDPEYSVIGRLEEGQDDGE